MNKKISIIIIIGIAITSIITYMMAKENCNESAIPEFCYSFQLFAITISVLLGISMTLGLAKSYNDYLNWEYHNFSNVKRNES